MRSRRAGFVHVELMIWIALIAVGLALGMPVAMKLFRHQPAGGWDWTLLAAGIAAVFFGVKPLVMDYLVVLLRARRQP
jgi:hypothetical protein